MKRLTKKQAEVMDLLRNGWQIGLTSGLNPHVWIQYGGAGKGGESRKLAFSTFFALREAGLLVETPGFPSAKYDAKDAA